MLFCLCDRWQKLFSIRHLLTVALLALWIPTPVQGETHQKEAITHQQKVIAFGRLSAVIAFCNFLSRIDAFDMVREFRKEGLSSADRSDAEHYKNESYQAIRKEYKTAAEHERYCRAVEEHPMIKNLLSQKNNSNPYPYSNLDNQKQKIELYGDAIGVFMFCKFDEHLDGAKLGKHLSALGVKLESMQSILARARSKKRELIEEYKTPEKSSEKCAEVRDLPFVQKLMKPE